jgi:hypothetical protein
VLADWGEGTSVAPGQQGAGAAATTNDATWLHRFWPGTFWTTPGGDFAPGASAISATPPSGTATWASTPQLVANVQQFLDQPAQNFGWLFRSNPELWSHEVRRFDSRQHSVSTRRPRLTITYLLPGTSMPVGSGCTGSGGLPFAMAAQNTPVPGQNFALALSNGQAGAVAALGVGLGFAPTPVAVYPGCLFDPNNVLVTVTFLNLGGSGSAVVPFPVSPGFLGLHLGFQAFASDTGLSPSYVLSNAVRIVVG